MVDELLAQAIDDGGLVLDPDAPAAGRRILFHGHCHQKAAGATAGSVALLQRIPRSTVEVLDAGCCGMAGSFGFEREHYDLSLAIGGMRLFPAVSAAPPDALIAATGVSCRQQIAQGTARRAVHPITMLRESINGPMPTTGR
jgi:Fe-S oxidoreductase